MIFALNVCAAPFATQSSYTAYRFAKTVVDQGHTLYRVFFYLDGVHAATSLAAPPQDEFDLYEAWKTLAKEHKVDLVVCIAAALKRGLINEGEAQRYHKDAHNLADGFTLGGLGQLIDAAAHADRLITFGN